MSNQASNSRQSSLVRLDQSMHRGFGFAERGLISLVAIALIILSCMALWDTVVLVRIELLDHNLTKAITTGVDTVFLTVILLELMHTVTGRGSLAEQVQEFIVIGITSGIRHGLSLVATSGSNETVTRIINHHSYQIALPGAPARDTVISLAINSGSVLLLVAALWLVRSRFGGKDDDKGALGSDGDTG